MYSDPIADLLTRLRNACRARHETTEVPASTQKENILQVLLEEGYIANFEKDKDADGKPLLRVFLRYMANGDSVLKEVSRLSRPGRRVYVGKKEIPRHRGGLGTVVVSTPKGMLCDREARREGVGGEIVCSVF